MHNLVFTTNKILHNPGQRCGPQPFLWVPCGATMKYQKGDPLIASGLVIIFNDQKTKLHEQTETAACSCVPSVM